MHPHLKGILAEFYTLMFYMLKLYIPLKLRYKTKVGEIDLIMRKGNTIVMVEVKSRSSGMHDNIVTYKQQNRIHRAAELFLSKNDAYGKFNVRFDLVVIRKYIFLQQIKNAW